MPKVLTEINVTVPEFGYSVLGEWVIPTQPHEPGDLPAWVFGPREGPH